MINSFHLMRYLKQIAQFQFTYDDIQILATEISKLLNNLSPPVAFKNKT